MLLGTCSHCNQPILNALVGHSFSTTSSVEEEIALVISESARLGNVIAQLHVLRASRLQQLNTLRSSTRNLPPEVLSTIFYHYLPHIKFDDFEPPRNRPPRPIRRDNQDKTPVPPHHAQVTILGAVSRQWRNVAYSTPQLWESAEVRVARKAIESKAHLIRLYLTNVKDTAFSLKLDPLPYPRTFYADPVNESIMSEVELQPIFHSIWERAEKIQRLSCNLFPSSWLGLLSNRFQILTQLSVYQLLSANLWASSKSPGPQVTPWSSIPRLSKISLTGLRIHIPRESPPCTSVTVLHMNLPDLIACVHLLSICPNLIEYQVKPLTEVVPSTSSLPPLPDTLIFPHMINFQVHCALQWPFYDLFPRLKLPVLETLGLGSTARDERDEVSNLLDFIRSLPISWSTLDLNFLFADSQGVVTQMLEAGIPENVSNLNILYSDTANLGRMLRVLRSRYPPHQRVGMPGLKRICIFHWQNGYQTFSLFGDNPSTPLPQVFVEMLSERRQELNGQFLLEMEADSGIHWGPYQKQFKSLVIEGLRVEIMVAGKLIPELRQVYDELDD